MDFPLIVSRVLHIGLGAFWAGTLIFNAVFLGPSVRDAGPDGAKVMGGVLRRRFLDVMPIVAGLTVLSGLHLYWRLSGGFSLGYARTPAGMAYGVGGLAAIVALGLGAGVLRPSLLRAAAITQAAAGAPADERDRALAEARALRTRAASVGRAVAWLLGGTTVLMAVARYL